MAPNLIFIDLSNENLSHFSSLVFISVISYPSDSLGLGRHYLFVVSKPPTWWLRISFPLEMVVDPQQIIR
jgi:hypothetical protein